MNEWFDIYSLTDPSLRRELQTEGLCQSVAFVRRLVEEEINDVKGDAGGVLLGGIWSSISSRSQVSQTALTFWSIQGNLINFVNKLLEKFGNNSIKIG